MLRVEMDINELTLENLRARVFDLQREWSSKKPFRYVIIDDFLPTDFAEQILATYPEPDIEGWDDTTYLHQRKKFTKTSGFSEPIGRFFVLTASPDFRDVISDITGIQKLTDDPDLVGGGLHQILRGGFLDVHVDYNFHPQTKLHRRMNLLLYLNKDWKPEYEGHLELWDLESNVQLDRIAPLFNRVVIFETNELSYHGHPRPLNTPQHITRKSLAIYYYTKEHGVTVVAPEHNTLYRQTTGIKGYVKTLRAATRTLSERVGSQNGMELCRNMIRRTHRYLRGLPPENK